MVGQWFGRASACPWGGAAGDLFGTLWCSQLDPSKLALHFKSANPPGRAGARPAAGALIPGVLNVAADVLADFVLIDIGKRRMGFR